MTDSRQSRSKQNSVSAPSAAQGSAQAGQAGSASSSQHPNDRDRKIGHRRVNENGEVSYKKVTTNQLMGSIQLGIGHAIGALAKADDRDLLMQDFMTVETTHFPKNGSQQTPAHSFSEYTFRTYAPLAFRYFLNLFPRQRLDCISIEEVKSPISLSSLCLSSSSSISSPASIISYTCWVTSLSSLAVSRVWSRAPR